MWKPYILTRHFDLEQQKRRETSLLSLIKDLKTFIHKIFTVRAA